MNANPVRNVSSAVMARREMFLSLLSLLLLTFGLLPTSLAGADQAKEAKQPLHPQRVGDDRINQEPLVIQLAQNAGSEHSKHTAEARHHSTSCHTTDPNVSEPSLTCSAKCPLCPACPPAQTCPSPCPTIPKCPEPQACPVPCKACPACPTCKRHIPPGYEHFAGLGYYRLHTVPVTWMDAKTTCEREGAHLAIINSQEEANLMKKLFSRDPDIGNWLYLGFHDLYKEGRYVTLFGQPLTSTGYTIWSTGQPDNHQNNEHCGSMYPSGGLNDLNCLSKQPFVCELPV